MSDVSDWQHEPRHIVIEADSVEEAIREGLDQLGLTRAEVTVEVLDEGGRGVLGIGARAARVRLTEGDVPYEELMEAAEAAAVETPAAPPPPPPQAERRPKREAARDVPMPAVDDEEVRITQDVVGELLSKLQVQATTEVRRGRASDDEGDPPWVLDIQGDDLGVLIGRRGDTLNALQYITRLIVSRELQRRANIVIDVQGYKTRRESTLRKLAQRMADEARYRGRTVKLEPMPPNERRIIHLALRDDPTVFTESEGMGEKRKVTIKLRDDQPD